VEPIGVVDRIWRYPVKSLRCVPLDEVLVDEDGLEGDRRAALYVNSPEHARAGKWYRGKEDNRLHLLEASTEAVRVARERGVAVEAKPGVALFDDAPVSIVFDMWVRELEAVLGAPVDPQRFRPNFYVRAAAFEGRREADFVGMRLRIGTCVFDVVSPIARCVTITYDPQTGEPDPRVLRAVAEARANVMGIYCTVLSPGRVCRGDRVVAQPTVSA